MNSLLIVVAAVIFILAMKSIEQKGTQIPGPNLVQMIMQNIKLKGNLPLLCSKWAQNYGPIFQLQFGPLSYIVLNDATLINETFGASEASGRLNLAIFDPFGVGSRGISNGSGVEGMEHRHFALTNIKKFGIHRTSTTNLVGQELTNLLANFEKEEGKPIEMKKQFSLASSNALWIVVANQRFESASKTSSVVNNFSETFEEISVNPGSFHPRLFYFLPWISVWKRYKESYKSASSHFETLIDEHHKTIIEGEPRDFIDAYLDKSAGVEDPNSIFHRAKNLPAILIDFVIGGSDTTSTALEWCVLNLGRNPDMQNKLRDDISRAVGMDKLPTAMDRPNLPSVESFIWEILRLFTPGPLGLPRQLQSEMELCGHKLPAGSILIANLYWVHRNPKIWKDVDEFCPERFLDEEGKLDRKAVRQLIPFGCGKRRCIGMDLALDTIFIFVVGLIEAFYIEPDPHHPLALECSPGVMCAPKQFSLVFNKVRTKLDNVGSDLSTQ